MTTPEKVAPKKVAPKKVAPKKTAVKKAAAKKALASKVKAMLKLRCFEGASSLAPGKTIPAPKKKS